MNILGKVLLWIAVVITLVAAIPLTTMTLDVRNKWLGEVNSRRDKMADSMKVLREARLRVRRLDEKLNQQLQVWGDVWTAPRSGVQPGGAGIVELGVGTSSGIGLKAQQQNLPPAPVYVFANENGMSQYLGEFKLEDLRADRTAGRLVREPYPQEVTNWPAQGEFTVRESLPADWRATVVQLDGEVLIASTKLRTQELALEILNEQIKESQASLDSRLAELGGDANPPVGASQEVVDGLVETLRKYETQRDTLLAQVNRIRHQLDASYVKLSEIVASNRAQVEQLSQSSRLTNVQASSTK